MIDLVADKLVSGDIYVIKARSHLEREEWGMAYRSLLAAFSKGNLSEEDLAFSLHAQIRERLGLRPHVYSDLEAYIGHSQS